MNRRILNIALPSIVSNISVPLLGLADTAIVGHLGATVYIGAIAVGTLLFNMTYWLFGFLRLGTGGLTSQSFGEGNTAESFRILLRSLALGVAIAILILLFQKPILDFALSIIAPSEEVEQYARTYYNILIWGAPAVLLLYCMSGWFLGIQKAKYVMYTVLMQNFINIPVSLLLVFKLGMKVEGVALGTLAAQYASLFLAFFLLLKERGLFQWIMLKGWLDGHQIRRFFGINLNIFLRTLCLIAVTTGFTSLGAKQGDTTLAANALLMQFFLLFSYIIDGFAFAGEALGGQYYGAKDKDNFVQVTRKLFVWGAGFALLFVALYGFGGELLLRILTNEDGVIQYASHYLPYVVMIPLISFSAFLFDGIFIGITHTFHMLLSMLFATAFFFIYAIYATTGDGNVALWIGFLGYLGLRGLVLYVVYRRSVLSEISALP